MMKNQWKIHPEIDAKSMENLCKIHPRKSNAKNMKKHRKWSPKGNQNLWKCDKKRGSKIRWFLKGIFPAGRRGATQRQQGEVYLPLKGGTPPGHRLAKLSGTRASSEPTFFDANFRIDFWWHFGDLLTPKSSKSGVQHEPKCIPKSIPKLIEN
jgi:hypothetical protein